MADLKMPEINYVIIAGNLTKDPTFRQTTNKTPVVNFSVASNRRYKDSSNQWQEDVCYVGIVAWNRLAESCKERLKKGSAVLIDGELQSRSWKTDDGHNRRDDDWSPVIRPQINLAMSGLKHRVVDGQDSVSLEVAVDANGTHFK